MPFSKHVIVSQCVSILIIFTCLLKTPNRRETQFYAERLQKIVLISHLDPIGNQNNAQQLSIYCIYIYGISGTVPGMYCISLAIYFVSLSLYICIYTERETDEQLHMNMVICFSM